MMMTDTPSSDHDDFGGLQRDVAATTSVMNRRGLLRLMAKLSIGASALPLVGCGETGTAPSAVVGTTVTTSSDSLDARGGAPGSPGGPGTPRPGNGGGGTTCTSKINEETAGPYPGDGSNGPNVLPLGGVERSDIRSSFAGLSGQADGVPLTISLTLVSASTCAPLAGYAVYLWQCDRLGRYSLYSSELAAQNYLRGVQQTNSSGRLTFLSIFPGCYAGRWPHLHFEVYPSLAQATSVRNKVATSQIALPKEACDTVYASSGYVTSVTNLSRVSLSSDNVFSDGYALELATITGGISGMSATLTVAV